jgi:O-antigen/teichoic acid export membrane protein
VKKEIFELGKDSIIYGIGSVITRFIALITLPFFTTHLDTKEYGIVGMLSLLSSILQPIFSLGLGAAMGTCYFEKNEENHKSETVWSVFLIHLVSSFVLVIIGWAFPAFIAKLIRLTENDSLLVSLSITGVGFTILTTSFMQWLQFEKKAKQYVFFTLISSLISISVCIYTVLYLGLGVKGMILGQVFGNTFLFLAFFILGTKNTTIKINFRIVKDLLNIGLALLPAFFFLFLLMNSNKYILESISGLDSVGIYSIGFSIGMTISIITNGISSAWYPFFMSYVNRQNEISILFGKILNYYFFIIGFIVVQYFIFAKPVLLILVNERYVQSHLIIGYVALANFCQMLFNFLLPGIYFHKDVKFISYIQGVSVLLSIPFTYVLIHKFTIVGAGIALFQSNLSLPIVLFIWNLYRYKNYAIIQYDWKRIFSVIIVFTLSIFFYYLLPDYDLYLELLKSSIISFFTLMAVFLLLNKNEKYFLKNKIYSLSKYFN